MPPPKDELSSAVLLREAWSASRRNLRLAERLAAPMAARLRDAQPSTLFDAIDHGHVRPLPGGGIDRADADRWFEGYIQRAELVRLGMPIRQRSLEAAAAGLAFEIHTLDRQIQELRRGSTVLRTTIEQARQRARSGSGRRIGWRSGSAMRAAATAG